MKVIVSAGGTGGHIFPALAIINKLQSTYKDCEIIYIGTHDRMEKDIIPKYNIKYIPIEIYGLSKREMLRNIKNVFLIEKSIKKCIKIMKEFKPDIVIGVGGYVTYPVITAANKLKIKTLIHEQNSIPGKSNRALSKKVDAICVSFKSSMKYFDKNKTYYTGNPCSEFAINNKPVLKSKFNISPNRKLILIVQGSLGSSVMNDKMLNFLNSIDNKNYDVLYVTGKNHYDTFSKNKVSKNVHIVPFIDNMSGLLKNVDVIVTRAGASSLSEIIALKVPNIIIPSPYVANNHQYYNALSIVESGSGFMIEEKDLNKDILISYIDKCLDTKVIKELKSNMNKIYINDSSTKIINIVKNIVGLNEKD